MAEYPTYLRSEWANSEGGPWEDGSAGGVHEGQ